MHVDRQLMATMWSEWTSLSQQLTVIWRPVSVKVKHCDATLGLHHHHCKISSVLIQRRP